MNKMKRLFAAAAAMVLAFVGASASATEINLTMNSWTDLKNAVETASTGDVISVTPIEGKYGEGEYYTAESTVTIGKSLTIRSANSSKPLKIYNGTTRLPVFEIFSGKADVTLEKIVFSGSDASSATNPQRGTIVSSADKLRLSYCTFDGCTAAIGSSTSGYAGAVKASGSLLIMNDCVFKDCRVINHVGADIPSLGGGNHFAGAVSTTAKETLVSRCSFIGNEIQGFKGVTDFMAKNMGAAIVAGDTATPTGEKPPVLTIMNSSFARNRGGCTVFAANEGLRIISSTFVDNGPASDNMSRGGRAVRFWHTKDYASAYQWTGNLYIVNSVFLGNWEEDTYLDINYTGSLPVYAYYSLFSKDTIIGSPGVGCKFLSAAESVAWYDFFLNSDKYTGSVPVVTTLLGVDHYAYPLSPRAYESGYKVAYNLYYKVEDTTPWVYGYGGSASSMVWAGFGTCPELADRPIQNAGVDRQYCYRSEGGNRTYLPSCGSAASYPSVVKFQKNKTGAAVYETVTAMWNYEKVTMPENDYEETGYTFKRWECNGKTYEPGEVVDVKDLSTQYFGEYRPDETIVVAPVFEPHCYKIYFQVYENLNIVLSSYISAWYGQPVTIRAPKDSVYDGYTVEGWATSKERAAAGTIDYVDGATITYDVASDLQLYWVNRKPNTATYSFKKNSPGGSTEFIIGDEFTMTVTTGGAQMVPTCPFVYPGYRFKCWFTGDNDENREDFYPGDGFGKVAVDGSTVPIYADWEKVDDFYILYNPNGGTGSATAQNVMSELGDVRLLDADTFSKKDCTLVGWSKDSSCTLEQWFYKPEDSAWSVAESGKDVINLYAVWQDNAGSLRTCPTGEGDISLLIEIIDPVKKTARLVNVLSKTGILSNWTIPDTATSSDKTVWTITEYGYLTFALAGVPEVTIGKFVTDGALCLQGDLGGNTRTKIHVPAANTAYASIDGLLVSKDKKHLLAVPCAWDNETHTLEIPEGIETIESGSCWSLKNVKTVIIPSTVCTDGAVKTGSFGTETQGQNWGPSPFSGKGISQFYFRGNFSVAFMESPDVFYATSWAVQTCPPIIRDDLHAVIGFIPHPSRDPSKGHTCAVVVPEGVTDIYDSAFEGCAQMTSLTLPSTLESIGELAFYYCTYLPSVDVPAAVEYIGNGAFACCAKLAEVTGGAGLGMNSVGYDVLGSTKVSETADENGTAAKIGSILVHQGDNGSLPKTLEVESDVTGIAGGAFCQLPGVETVKLPASVAWIEENAFEECEGLVRIRHFIGTEVNGDFAGESNEDLCELEIYGSAAADTIDSSYNGWAGFGNGDITLVIGSGIKTIAAYAFNRPSPEDKDIFEVLGGDDLTDVSRDAFTGTWFAAAHRAIGTFYVGYFGSDVSIVMPDGNPGDGTKKLTRVAPTAFRTLTSAKTLRFGKYIDAEQLTGSMFKDLVALNSYAIDSTAANYATDLQGILYNKTMTKIIAVPKNLAGTIEIPASVTEIGESAFADCSQLKSIIGGGNVVNIGEHAFDNCPANPFKDMASVRLWDCAFNLVQTIPGTTLKPVDLPHPTNLAAVVDSIPYGTWPVSGEWYCSNDDKNYKDSFQPKVAGEYYDLKPALQDVMGDYSIAYDKNAEDATGTMDPQIEGIGYLTTLDSNVFVRPGYTFKGWNTMSDGSGASFGDGEMVCFDWPDVFAGDTVTLYAQWSDKPAYTLAFDGASEYATDVPSPMTGFVGEYVTIPSATPSREGWAFDAWTDASRSQRWTAGYEYFVLEDWEIGAGETYTLYALWTEGSDNGTYTDAQGTEWHYGRNGDEIGITYVTPGPTAAYPLTMPTTIKGGTVNVAKSIKLPVKIGKIWWNWQVIDEKEKTCGLTYPILGSGEKLPDDVVLPEQIEGYALVAALFEDSFADGANVTSITIWDDGETKTIWGERDGEKPVTTIHVPGAAPVDWECPLVNLFCYATTCCYDPDESSWTAYKDVHAGQGLAFVPEGTYEIRFNKNAEDATGTMPNKVCVIGRKYPPLEGTEMINYTREGWTFVDWFYDPECTEKVGLGGEFWNLSTTPDDVVDVYALWSEQPLEPTAAKAVLTDEGQTLIFVYDDVNYGVKGTDWFSVAEAEAQKPYNAMPWQGCAGTVTTVAFGSSFKSYKPKHCGSWFWDFYKLTTVVAMENLDTSKATSLCQMFSGCYKLASLDLSGFDTANVEQMYCMFFNCSGLTTILASESFTTAGVLDSSDMFKGCTKLTGGNGTKYDAAKVDAGYARIDKAGTPGYFTGSIEPPEPETVTVTFDANGGVAAEKSRIVEKGAAVGRLPAAAAEGKAFLGWFNARTGGYKVEATTVVEADVTFFAHWAEPAADEYVVVFDANGGTASEYYRFVKQNAALGELPTAERDGFNFVGWFTAPAGGEEVTAATAVTGHAVCHAHWVTKSGTVISLDDERVAFAAIPDQVYAGTAAEPEVEMTFDGNPCAEGGDYELEYADNDWVGVATVTVTGVGNFSGSKTLTFNILPVRATAGEYLSLDLEEDLGVEIDADYKAGDKVAVKVEGLAKGLKVAQDKTTGAWVMTGVPTETIDVSTQTMFARVTVTYKDKTKGVKGKGETLQPLPIEIVAAPVRTLTAGVLSALFKPVDIATLWPEVADAEKNPKDWTFKGWPTGILYNNTDKDKAWKYKDPETGTQVTTSVSPYEVYGLPTKAGTFTVTATRKYKPVGAAAAVSETLTATMTVWADAEEKSYRYTDQVGVATTHVSLGANVKTATGLPTGLKFAKGVVSGTPTKAGVFVVALTMNDKSKETFLWLVNRGSNDGVLSKIGWTSEDAAVTVMQGVIQNWSVDVPAGAKVTVTGLPTGLAFKQDTKTKLWAFGGTPTKDGAYVVTFKTVLNGETVTERISIIVEPNEWTGNWYGVQKDSYTAASLNVLVNVAANGTVKLTLQEGVAKTIVKTSVTAKNLNADGHSATLEVVKNKVVVRTFTVDFSANTFAIGGTVAADLYETTDSYAADKSVLTFVLEEDLPGETNAYAYVTATYDAKKNAFTLAGKLWDGTAVKGTSYPLDKWAKWDGNVLSPVLLTDKAKNSVYLELSDDGSQCRVLENGEKISIGRNGTTPWMGYYLAAELKGKTFAGLVPEATACVVLSDDGEIVIDGLTTKELGTKLAANGLAKLTLTDKFGWKWVCEMLPVDNNDETQFRGIATGTKKGETTQYAPVWSK